MLTFHNSLSCSSNRTDPTTQLPPSRGRRDGRRAPAADLHEGEKREREGGGRGRVGERKESAESELGVRSPPSLSLDLGFCFLGEKKTPLSGRLRGQLLAQALLAQAPPRRHAGLDAQRRRRRRSRRCWRRCWSPQQQRERERRKQRRSDQCGRRHRCQRRRRQRRGRERRRSRPSCSSSGDAAAAAAASAAAAGLPGPLALPLAGRASRPARPPAPPGLPGRRRRRRRPQRRPLRRRRRQRRRRPGTQRPLRHLGLAARALGPVLVVGVRGAAQRQDRGAEAARGRQGAAG